MSFSTSPARSPLWRWLMLLGGLFVLSACEPEFTDQFCVTEADCFSFETCVDGTCQRKEPEPILPPVIELFEADPEEVDPGENVVLRWQTRDATRVVLQESPGNRQQTINDAARVAEGQTTLPINVNTTMRLTATNSEGEKVFAEVELKVREPEPPPTQGPVINSFDVSQSRVDVGAEVTLTWTSEHGREGTLMANDTAYELTRADLDEGSMTVSVDEDTTFRLMVLNVRGMAQSTVEVVLDRPTVERFSVETQNAIVGDPVTLGWETTKAETVEIVGPGGVAVDLGGAAAEEGSVEISAESGDSYTLTATNGNGEVSASLTVELVPRLEITTFETDAATIRIGQSAELSWTVAGGATSIAIEDQNGNPVAIAAGQLATGSVTVSPTQDTTYTLTVSTDLQEQTATVDVLVLPPDPVITSFTVNTTPVLPGATVTLTWAIADPYLDEVEIIGVGGNAVDLTGKNLNGDSIQVVVPETTTFTLRATNAGGQDEATVTVNVQAAVVITSFTGSNNFLAVDPGTSVTLSWNVQNATALNLIANTGGSQVPVNIAGQPLTSGSVVVTPTSDTTYTLTADGLPNPAVRSVTVNIHRPTVTSFTVTGESGNPNVVIAGEAAVLSWTTSRATNINLTAEPGGLLDTSGAGVATGTLQHTPTVNTTYTLIADNGSYPSEPVVRTVTVVAPLEITSFAVEPSTVAHGDSVTLSWQTSGEATAGRIRDGQGNTYPIATGSLATGQMQLSPTQATTYVLEVENAYQDIESDPLSVTVTYPDAVVSFDADVTTVISGDAVELSWETTLASSLSLCVQGGACLDLTGLSIEEDSLVVRPQVTTTYVLTATNPGGTDSATVDVEVVAAPLHIAEVFYHTPDNDAGLQWVEITNGGDTFVDLANYSLGSGGNDYTATTLQLSGVLAPGGCFVVGGASTLDNYEPALDQVAAFSPSIALPTAGNATGVGLFFGLAAGIDAQSVPVDAVVFGDVNSGGLLGSDGTPMTALSPEVALGESLARTSATSDVFIPKAAPSPGRCFHVAALSPEGGANDAPATLTITGYGFDLDTDVVTLEGIGTLSCTALATGLECTIPATTHVGLSDLTISREARYVADAEGNPSLELLAPAHHVVYVIDDAYEFEAPID